MVQPIKGLTITRLNVIENEKGEIFHFLKQNDANYVGFGEAYFSTVKKGVFKGWKQHQRMTMNIVVPVGAILFYFVNESSDKVDCFSVEISPKNYLRITLEPGVWMGFKGISEGLNLLMNIGSIPHDKSEAIQRNEEYWMDLFTK